MAINFTDTPASIPHAISQQPTYGTNFEDALSNPAIMDGLNGVGTILQLVFFLFYAYFQYMLSKKLDVKYSWMAWIPLLNILNYVWISGRTIGWYLKQIFVIGLLPVIVLWSLYGGYAWFFPDSASETMGLVFIILSVLSVVWSLVIVLITTIKLVHGISKRTGHGKWWTAGLIFAPLIVFPVTAVHYQKGDEITPRPFAGWKKALLIISSILFAFLPLFIFVLILAASSSL